jgi:hypothetical protein
MWKLLMHPWQAASTAAELLNWLQACVCESSSSLTALQTALYRTDAATLLDLPLLPSCRLLLEITAMRYGCVNHTTFSTCAADQSNWCTWHEEARRCGMYYDDADFVHLMLWSGTKVACAGGDVWTVW